MRMVDVLQLGNVHWLGRDAADMMDFTGWHAAEMSFLCQCDGVGCCIAAAFAHMAVQMLSGNIGKAHNASPCS